MDDRLLLLLPTRKPGASQRGAVRG